MNVIQNGTIAKLGCAFLFAFHPSFRSAQCCMYGPNCRHDSYAALGAISILRPCQCGIAYCFMHAVESAQKHTIVISFI